LAIGGVSSALDSFLVTESSVLRTNFCAEKPAHRQSADRYRSPYERPCLNSTDRQMNEQANASAKSKELHTHAQTRPNAAHLLLHQPHNRQLKLN